MQAKKQKQAFFRFSTITIDSQFQSGNLQNAEMLLQNQFNLWIGSDPNANYRTWFYFSIQGIKQGCTVTFTIMNMSNQVKLLKEGHLPVFKTDISQQWNRIRIPISQNGIVKGELGFQLTFKHAFMDNSKHYFAFTFPWTNVDNQQLITCLMEKSNVTMICKKQELCKTFKSRPLNILTITKVRKGQQIKFEKKIIGNNQFTVFPNRIGILISSRVHPGEVASSHIMNGVIKNLFNSNQLSTNLLESCVFYLIPILNPDGVAQGNFRTDSQGKNLNRYYTNPDPQGEPQIYYAKQFIVEMIKSKYISFYLDLHAHVNKQGAFIYGNSTNILVNQMKVCLFPKLLSFNSEIFDFDSCNFSEKNMMSKDKGQQLSKQGASRVAIFKQTGLPQCWTLQCNYNSARISHQPPQYVQQSKNSNVSNAVLCSRIEPQYKEEVKLLEVRDFESLGLSILQSISDFYQLRSCSRIYSSKLKNMQNVQLNIAISSLRLIPFRFDTQCRKILDNINSSLNIKANMDRLSIIIGHRRLKEVQPNSLSTSVKSMEQEKRRNSFDWRNKSEKDKITSLKKVEKSTSKQKVHSVNSKNKITLAKIKFEPKSFKSQMPNIPKPNQNNNAKEQRT